MTGNFTRRTPTEFSLAVRVTAMPLHCSRDATGPWGGAEGDKMTSPMTDNELGGRRIGKMSLYTVYE